MKTTISEKANAVKPLPANLEDEARHTPGPWKALSHVTTSDHTPAHVEVRGVNGIEAIADCFYGHSDAERFANARLIASAPALLEALRSLSHLCEVMNNRQHAGLDNYDAQWSMLSKLTEESKAAIAQAEGGQQ